jgi:hypothetical protein
MDAIVACSVDWNMWVAIFTLLLAVSTVLLAIYTARMARIAQRSLRLEERPYLAFVDFQGLPGAPDEVVFRPLFKLENKGRIPVGFEIKSVSVQANNRVSDKSGLDGKDGIAFPGASAEFVAPTIQEVDVKKFWTGRAQVEVEYWAFDMPSKRYRLVEEFDFNGDYSRNWHRWTRTKIPIYT